MKVWEALELLQGMNGNAEVTVTMGKPKLGKQDDWMPTQPSFPYQPQPNWVIGKEHWPTNPNTITCRLH